MFYNELNIQFKEAVDIGHIYIIIILHVLIAKC